MFSMQSVSKNPLIAAFQLSSAASLNVGRSQNGVLEYGLNKNVRQTAEQSMFVLDQRLLSLSSFTFGFPKFLFHLKATTLSNI